MAIVFQHELKEMRDTYDRLEAMLPTVWSLRSALEHVAAKRVPSGEALRKTPACDAATTLRNCQLLLQKMIADAWLIDRHEDPAGTGGDYPRKCTIVLMHLLDATNAAALRAQANDIVDFVRCNMRRYGNYDLEKSQNPLFATFFTTLLHQSDALFA